MRTQHTFLCILLIVFLVAGCAALKNNGIISRSDDVSKAFETATIVPDHTYFYTGPEAQPDAIIGIANKYTLRNAKNFWVKVDISEKILQDWNVVIDNNSKVRTPYYGAYIMTPGREQVGIWYSRYIHTPVKFPDANTVVVYIPGLTPNNPLEPNPFTPRF